MSIEIDLFIRTLADTFAIRIVQEDGIPAILTALRAICPDAWPEDRVVFSRMLTDEQKEAGAKEFDFYHLEDGETLVAVVQEEKKYFTLIGTHTHEWLWDDDYNNRKFIHKMTTFVFECNIHHATTDLKHRSWYSNQSTVYIYIGYAHNYNRWYCRVAHSEKKVDEFVGNLGSMLNFTSYNSLEELLKHRFVRHDYLPSYGANMEWYNPDLHAEFSLSPASMEIVSQAWTDFLGNEVVTKVANPSPTQFHCHCGAVIQKKSVASHLRTAKHNQHRKLSVEFDERHLAHVRL